MDAEVALRRVRHARFLRLATLHAGPLGLALLGRPELAPLYAEAYAFCPGAAGLACEGVGGVPRACLVHRLEHLARSALRGGKRRRAQERAYVEGLLTCLSVLKGSFPEALRPALELTEKALREDLAYLDGRLPQEVVHPPQKEDKPHRGRRKDDE
ncbi:MAG: hypothetical protein C4300_03100 [Thermus sp.]